MISCRRHALNAALGAADGLHDPSPHRGDAPVARLFGARHQIDRLALRWPRTSNGATSFLPNPGRALISGAIASVTPSPCSAASSIAGTLSSQRWPRGARSRHAGLLQPGRPARGCVVRWISTWSGQIFRALRKPALDQRGRTDRQSPDLDQRLEFQPGRMLAAVADRDVDARGVEVGILMRGLDAQRQPRIAPLEIRQRRQQHGRW